MRNGKGVGRVGIADLGRTKEKKKGKYSDGCRTD